MQTTTSRRLLGLGAMFAATIVLDLLPSVSDTTLLTFADQNFFVPGLLTVLLSLVPFTIGAYVARGQFLPIAVSFALVIWFFAQYFLNQIGIPAGHDDLFGVALGNVPGLLMLLVAAGVGTVSGEWQYERRKQMIANAS